MIVCSDLSPSGSLRLDMSEHPAPLQRRIDFNGKTQIRANTLQSLALLERSPSQRDAHDWALKRSLINYSMTRRNKRRVSFDGSSLHNALFITLGWRTKNITFPPCLIRSVQKQITWGGEGSDRASIERPLL